jgi:PKD repeat protein
MRDSSYVRTFPLKTPYFVVSSTGVLSATPVFAEWLAGLGFLEDNAGIVFISQNHPSNGFAVKTSTSTPAQVLVPMDYISRIQASSGSLTVIGPLTVAYNLPLPSATQNIFAFKNGILQASVPATIPTSASDTWAIVVTNDKPAGSAAQYSATLAASPLTGTHASTLITFTLTETNKPSGATGSYSWNFGDGSAVTVTSTPTTTYTYPTAGTFTAKCTPTLNGVTQAQVTAAAPAVIS